MNYSCPLVLESQINDVMVMWHQKFTSSYSYRKCFFEKYKEILVYQKKEEKKPFFEMFWKSNKKIFHRTSVKIMEWYTSVNRFTHKNSFSPLSCHLGTNRSKFMQNSMLLSEGTMEYPLYSEFFFLLVMMFNAVSTFFQLYNSFIGSTSSRLEL